VRTYGVARCGFCKQQFTKNKAHQRYCDAYCRYNGFVVRRAKDKPTLIVDGEVLGAQQPADHPTITIETDKHPDKH
jgi:hypothetical protein